MSSILQSTSTLQDFSVSFAVMRTKTVAADLYLGIIFKANASTSFIFNPLLSPYHSQGSTRLRVDSFTKRFSQPKLYRAKHPKQKLNFKLYATLPKPFNNYDSSMDNSDGCALSTENNYQNNTSIAKIRVANVHMLSGFICAGKSTQARRLEQSLNAVTLSGDETILTLFGTDFVVTDVPKFAEQVHGLHLFLAKKFVDRGIDVVLDWSFWWKKERDAVKQRIKAMGANPILYHLQCERETLERRRLHRNKNLRPGEFFIDKKAFDGWFDQYEPPSADENAILVTCSQADDATLTEQDYLTILIPGYNEQDYLDILLPRYGAMFGNFDDSDNNDISQIYDAMFGDFDYSSDTQHVLSKRECKPCDGGVPPLQGLELFDQKALLDIEAPGWNFVDCENGEIVQVNTLASGCGVKLQKQFRFQNFQDGMDFTQRVAAIAEQYWHHPDIQLSWGKVTMEIWTKKCNGLTESDFVLAAKVDTLVTVER